MFDAGEDIDALMMLCEADITSKNKMKVKRYLNNFEIVRKRLIEVEESDRMHNWQPPITGEIIMQTFGLHPVNKLVLLKMLSVKQYLTVIFTNTYDEAYKFMIKKASELNLFPVE